MPARHLLSSSLLFLLTAASVQGQLRLFGAQYWTQSDLGLVLQPSEAQDQMGKAVAVGDFNGDGVADLAVGAPFERPTFESGLVSVIYGRSGGLTAAGAQAWDQADTGQGVVENFDMFGQPLAAGDFNGDGYDDLAIGARVEEVDGLNNAGVVNVLYGGSGGLSSSGAQVWDQTSTGVGVTGDFELFGSALAVGNFDNDEYDDLAIGVPFDDLFVPGSPGHALITNAGAVNVLYGTSAGLSATDAQLWEQDDIGAVTEAEDRFGFTLATGDFDGDTYDDLAIGVPFEDLDPYTFLSPGEVNVIHGTAAGLSATDAQVFRFDDTGLGSAGSDDRFGFSLASGNFDGDAYHDLAIGADQRWVSGLQWAGAVAVLYGASGGLGPAGAQLWHQDAIGFGGAVAFDHFADALTAGDFDGSGEDDLAIGVRFKVVESMATAGAVNVIYGGGSGLSATGAQFLNQRDLGLQFAPEVDNQFGAALATGDLDRSGADDLAIGIPLDDVDDNTIGDAGAVAVFYGTGILRDGFETGDTSAWAQP